MLRTIGGAVQASLALAALAVLSRAGVEARPEPPREPRDAAGWVAAYNARDFGQPGVQRVSIELTSGPQVTRRFTVVNAWRADGHRVDSVYFLEAPPGMAGTAYLHSEIAADAPDLSVRLFLPSGQRQVLTVASGEYGEGLLGSDFTYEDFRKRLPVPWVHLRARGARRHRRRTSGGAGCRAAARRLAAGPHVDGDQTAVPRRGGVLPRSGRRTA